jgi:hypothetical protein
LLENLKNILQESKDSSDQFGTLTQLGSSKFMQHFNQTGLYDTWLKFKNGEQFELLSIEYTEFQNRSCISLISELIKYLDKSEEIRELEKVRKILMRDELFKTIESRKMSVTISNVLSTNEYLKHNIIIDRWEIKE